MTVRKRWLISLLGGSGLAALLALCLPNGDFLIGWLGGSALAIPAVFGLLCAWQFTGRGRALAWLLAAAFLLRIFLGVFLALALPAWGNDSEAPNAGYIFPDAYRRDQLAWQMAAENQPLAAAFEESGADQYGGLLVLSTLVYRLLSPDAHRPWLILLLGAFTLAVGSAFLWRGLQQRWGNWIAGLAVGIFALYPESLLLGASQMREPFLLGLSCLVFWAILERGTAARTRMLVLAASLAGMLLISLPAGLLSGLIAAGWLLLQVLHLGGARRWLVWGLLAAFVLIGIILFWDWIWMASNWDSSLAERGSGWMQALNRQMSPAMFRTFLVGYGLAQPVLPATLFEPALPLMQVISILRALGWYLLAPFLVYGLFAAWKAPSGVERRVLVWSAAAVLLWTVLSSIRAGGDMWDNPRYRTLVLPWMALLAAWGWQFARQTASPWLKRAWMVSAIFVAGFILWYFTRYVPGLGKLDFPVVLGGIALASLGILGGGWLLDRHSKKKIPSVRE